MKSARAAYFAKLITSSKLNSRVLFNTINNIVSPPLPAVPVYSNNDCNTFLSFFVEKVANVRANIYPSAVHSDFSSMHTTQSSLSSFSPVSLPELLNVVGSMKSSTSIMDIIPTSLLKEVISSVAPNLITIINKSLISGVVPSYFKQAAVQPLLKKPSLDPSVPQNYRPISKLPFVSKLLEKVVANQLSSYLAANHIGDKFQSGF